MVNNKTEHSVKRPAKQAPEEVIAEPNKIGDSTPYDFEAKNLTAYGGLLPVATMLEKLGFQQVVEETVTVKRVTRAMPMYQFVLAVVLAVYVGFSRLHHLRFLSREPMLTGILKVLRLPPQCTFWRFLASLHLGVARQLLEVHRRMRERVWEAAHVQLAAVTLDTDTTVHTLFGNQMGGRKSYNPKNKGKKSYQPILTFLAETREYISGELRNGDRPTGAQIARHLENVFAALSPQVTTIYARADSGFYCWDAVEAYQKRGAQFIISAQKTSRLVDELKAADWKRSPRTDADGQCEFRYQPEGWAKAYRFIALRYRKKPKPRETGEPEQYQQSELTSMELAASDQSLYLRLTHTLTEFRERLHAKSETMEMPDRQQILRLLVKEIFVGTDTITLQHSLPMAGSEPPSGGPVDGPGSPGAPSGTPSGASYLLRSGSEHRPFADSLPPPGTTSRLPPLPP